MKKLTLLAFIATSFAADLPAHNDEMKQLWSAWKDKHSKQYPEDEESNRLDIFAENHKKIHAHNAKNTTVTLGLNQFSDLTADEFKAQYTGGYLPLDQSAEEGRRLEGEENKRFLASLPASVDWRKKGAVTPVKNQHQCKGCWAFSSAAAIESLHYIKSGNLINFSEQQLIDCDKTSHGCNAGHFSTAFAYTASKGIELESDYPFLDRTATCKYTSSKTYHVNTGFKSVSSHNANALMTAIVSQPVSVAIEADQHIFQFYKSGVITGSCGSALDHAVLAVGYATVNGHQAFIVKNSYGTGWGDSGYVYISTSSSANGGAGVCGILTAPGYPTA